MQLTPSVFTPADWLRTKPYTHFLPYDAYYVTQCRHIHESLLDYEDWFDSSDMSPDNLVQLAGMLGSYFEDFTSEIGIWRAFVEHNQSLYSYYLPFYDLTDYDPDYLNIADIAYLIWQYLANHYETRILAPDHPYIMALAQEIFALLEDAIDNAPATGFYETYFTVRSTDSLFDVKDKLRWFALESYLLGQEFWYDYQADVYEQTGQLDVSLRSKFAYMLGETYALEKRSSFSALNGPDWFAGVARCAPEQKEWIRQLSVGHSGKYILLDTQDESYLTVRHGQTDRVYQVLRSSIGGHKALSKIDTHLISMTLRHWQHDWWLAGIMLSEPTTEAKRAAYRQSMVAAAWLYDEEKQTALYASEARQRQAFYDCFGGPLVIFEDEKAYMAGTERLLEYSRQLAMKNGDTKELPPDYTPPTPGGERLPPEFRKAKDIGLFYRNGEGSLIFPNVQSGAIDVLLAENPTDEQKKELFELMAVSMNPFLGRYLLDTYGTKNIEYPLRGSAVNAVRDMEFMWRFHSPEDFGPVFPNISLWNG